MFSDYMRASPGPAQTSQARIVICKYYTLLKPNSYNKIKTRTVYVSSLFYYQTIIKLLSQPLAKENVQSAGANTNKK